MKNIRYFALSVLALAGLASCQKEYDFFFADNGPEITVVSYSDKVAMGSTIKFEVSMQDELPLSTLTAELYFDEEKVSDVTIRTTENKAYTGSVTVPYYEVLSDGVATLKLTAKNANLGVTVKDLEVTVSRPNPEYLTFVAGEKEYRAARTADYEYSLTAELPQTISGYFKTPAIDADGTTMSFGWDAVNKKIAYNTTDAIPYTYYNAGEWTIKVNILDFTTEPFLVPVKVGDKYMSAIDDGYELVFEMQTGTAYAVSGLEGIADYQIDEDYFKTDGGTTVLAAPSGAYRMVVDTKNKFIYAEVYKDGKPASLQGDGTGAIWIVGEKVGKPTLDNEVGWNTGKALCMVPVEAGKYQITLTGGKSIKADAVNFKFFGGAKSWDNAFSHTTLTTTSDIVGIGTGAVDESGEKHDDGNLYVKKGMSFAAEKSYVFTIDVTAGVDKAVLTVKEKMNDPDPYQVVVEKIDENTMAATLNLIQNKQIKLVGIDMTGWWVDDNYLKANADGSLTVKVVDGKYRITVKKDVKRIFVQRVNVDGSDATVNEDGTGGIWLMAWGVGLPSLDYQLGFNAGKAYCMAEVAPAVYKLTGKTGPETGSVEGQYFRYDYLSIKFFHQNGWGGEMKDPTFTSGTEAFIKDDGNLVLSSGNLEENATYEFTVDLTAGKNKPVLSFRKL